MSLLSVVQGVCAVVGVEIPQSVTAGIGSNRTMQEMLALATEMAQRIAYDTRDWTALRQMYTFYGDGVTDPDTGIVTAKTSFFLPNNYKRLLLTSNVWRSTSTQQPMRFIADPEEWLQNHLSQQFDANGEWTILADEMHINPRMMLGTSATFMYLDKNCINIVSGGQGDAFSDDFDKFRLDERVLKLGMIYQWKANKGSPYAEDMGNFSDALANVSGRDAPAPIIIGRSPMSAYHKTAGVGSDVGWNWPLTGSMGPS
jgi:hypothetical protein